MRNMMSPTSLGVGFLTAALLCSIVTVSNAADKPSPSDQQPPPAGDVQERGIQRMPQGGTTGPIRDTGSVGFSCDHNTHTCSCRLSKAGDCELMKAVVCGSGFNCPGSSQTCTCKALK